MNFVRKKNLTLCGVMLGIILVGCGKGDKITSEQLTEKTGIQLEDTPIETTSYVEVSEIELKELMDRNNYVYKQVYGAGDLPLVEEEIDYNKTRLYQVKDDVFEDYATFETYIKDTYCQAEVEHLLYNYPEQGQQKYVEQDGKLYMDVYYMGGKGYYVDWSDYTIEITRNEADICEFTAIASVEQPSDTPIKERYEAQGVVIKENGRWLLKEMIG